ncbi:hypothetical protein N0B51_04470 [Tsuneonella sp. YG55]|uniref:Uncharacterized protein n=1 Tax=Tsuneonella litorea TaxID=2976475 RepID=A0A9X3AMC5_9SPHN|nr:hypothetical protein [Tsuneonella litorea]MCT2558227.1 hypothetical protein [Tsuneonella litorea]
MLRRILACFALITGLTAAGSPAEARIMAVMTQSVVEATQSQQQAPATACEAIQQRANLRSKGAGPAPCRPRKPVVIIIPTIQFGPDRALE